MRIFVVPLSCRISGWKLAFTLIFLLFPAVMSESHARCLGSGDPVVDMAEWETGRNPADAVEKIAAQIAATDPARHRRIAYLYLAQAIAHRMNGTDESFALRQAELSARFRPPDRALNLAIHLSHVDELDDEEEARRVLDRLVTRFRSIAPDAAAKPCLGVDFSSLYSDKDRSTEAFRYAARVYRGLQSEPNSRARAEAASMLAFLVSTGHDYDYARKLHSEALDYFLAEGLRDLATDELLLRGYTSLEDGNWRAALTDFRASAAQAETYGNEYAVDYAYLGICSAALKGEAIALAASACDRSYKALSMTGDRMAYPASALQGASLAAQGFGEQALAVLDPLLDSDRHPFSDADQTLALESRAKAYNLLGRHEEAYSDLQRALTLRDDSRASELQEGMNVTQARFQTRQLQEGLADEQHHREASQRLMTAVIVGAGATLSLLLILISILLRHRRKFRRLALIDSLTGLPNRRAIQAEAEAALEASRDNGSPASMALIDLDHFKTCNDLFGHNAGDEALREFANVAEGCLRPTDSLGRWGGEEFLFVCPEASKSEGEAILDRIRMEAARVHLQAAPTFRLHFSAGLIEVDGMNQNFDTHLIAADRRLYRAKALGRNRTCATGNAEASEL